jgi:hypothetical protein
MRDIALAAHDAEHAPGVVEFNDRLGEIEIDRAARGAALIEQQREFFHAAEIISKWRVTAAGFGIAFDHLVDIGVGHALGRAHDAGCEIGPQHFSGGVQFHDDAHHQAVHLRIQRADAVG